MHSVPYYFDKTKELDSKCPWTSESILRGNIEEIFKKILRKYSKKIEEILRGVMEYKKRWRWNIAGEWEFL